MTGSNSAVVKRQLGIALRRWRAIAGLNRDQVASALGCSDSKVTRIEIGDVGVKPTELVILLDLYGVPAGAERNDLVELGAQTRARRPRTSYGAALPDWFRRYVHLAEGATGIKTVESVLPGYFHTEETARAILSASPLPATNDIERLVQERMARQKWLIGDDPKTLHAVIREGVLGPEVGGRRVHRKQLERLREMAEWDNVTVQIVPNSTGADPAMGYDFTLLELPNKNRRDLDVVYLEDATSARYIDQDPKEQARYGQLWSSLTRSALSPEQSVEWLSTLASRP